MAARRIVGREPNERLQALMEEANCSNVGLARRVNLRGAEHGLDLRYDKTSVSRWLRGQQPRGMTPLLISEVFSDKLGRPVSVDELGMTGGRQREIIANGLVFVRDFRHAVHEACELWRWDATRRNFMAGSGLMVSSLLGPSRDWLIAEADAELSHAGGITVRKSDTELLLRTTHYLADLDHRYGSGHVKPIAVHYLNSVVSSLLSGSYGESEGRPLCSATARLTELVGYMALDDGKIGLAQRYYVQALRLSHAAGERGFGAYVMAVGMGRLAAVAGYPREAMQLARAALEGARGQVTATVQSCLYCAEARGHALIGDDSAYELAASRAVEALERADPSVDPEWIRHFDRAYLADELAHCSVSLRKPALAARRAEEALTSHPDHRVRRRAIDLLLLATAHLQADQVEAACHAANQALPLIGGLRSHLSLRYLRDFQEQLLPHVGNTAVRTFQQLVDCDEFATP